MVYRPGTVINISGLNPVDDPEYRYKMPVVYGKIEGRGNGIKTVIPNIIEVALSLHRTPGEVNKFFGCELGAQTSYSEETEKAIVNGAHSDDVLQSLIHKYIQGFVLCPGCGLPETDYKIKNGCIWHRCAACGAKEMVDMSHKLCTYILGQDKKAKKDKSSKKDKDESKEKGDKKKKDDKDKDSKKHKEEKDKKERKEKKNRKEKKSEGEDKKDDESKGYIEEALFGKKDDDVASTPDDDSEESEAGVDDSAALELAIDEVAKFIKNFPDASAVEVSEFVSNQQMSFALKSHHKILMFMRAVITANCFKEKQIQKFSPVIKKITQKNPIMERHLIGAVEGLCAEKPKYFPVMIKILFDEDALDEGVILTWAADGRSEFTLDTVAEEVRVALRSEADPVITWLQQDDSSDDEESDSD